MLSIQQSFKSPMLLRKDEQVELGTNLKQLRKERNLTQEDLAECLGVSPQTVSKWGIPPTCREKPRKYGR
jgi:DNA-binding transcriptional regulator YiaG